MRIIPFLFSYNKIQFHDEFLYCKTSSIGSFSSFAESESIVYFILWWNKPFIYVKFSWFRYLLWISRNQFGNLQGQSQEVSDLVWLEHFRLNFSDILMNQCNSDGQTCPVRYRLISSKQPIQFRISWITQISILVLSSSLNIKTMKNFRSALPAWKFYFPEIWMP